MSESRTKSKADLEKLILHFEKNIYQFKSPTFNEAQTRQFLIDPFFEVLGWDISNKQMLPPYKIEVLPEGRVRSYSGKADKNQAQLFSSETAVKEEQKEYASFLEYIADDEYKAEQRAATKKPDYRFQSVMIKLKITRDDQHDDHDHHHGQVEDENKGNDDCKINIEALSTVRRPHYVC